MKIISMFTCLMLMLSTSNIIAEEKEKPRPVSTSAVGEKQNCADPNECDCFKQGNRGDGKVSEEEKVEEIPGTKGQGK